MRVKTWNANRSGAQISFVQARPFKVAIRMGSNKETLRPERYILPRIFMQMTLWTFYSMGTGVLHNSPISA